MSKIDADVLSADKIWHFIELSVLDGDTMHPIGGAGFRPDVARREFDSLPAVAGIGPVCADLLDDEGDILDTVSVTKATALAKLGGQFFEEGQPYSPDPLISRCAQRNCCRAGCPVAHADGADKCQDYCPARDGHWPGDPEPCDEEVTR